MSITLLRAIIIYIFITVAMRVMGKRQIGELNPQELVITILISAVATVPLENNGMPLANSLIPIAIFISFEIINSTLSMKSIKFRALIKGKPRFIIKDGKIQQGELTKLRFTIDDLTDAVRQAGVFDISQVANAIVETNGVVSVQKKSEYAPLTPKDMGIKTEDAEVPITAIVDGKAVADCFGNVNIDENEAKLIAISNGEQPQNILVMTIKNDGTAYIVAKEEQ
ncbi:MAG: DUF421 domain-containing protein [Eubacterium coprostanoligenes]|uniref:DUF421 domain-containing protein n=1 Tax=Eubacterium coprostanoligenes TaxID=290054 RepID=UPI002353D556|nr:DUF421 domain-containing protein [Eubacterium coprostanoligenes]MCI7264506.1 DUF421 domain-containing protein [Eubacterium coprostanoligenes]MDD6665743.1 DUF421 domain-containing protein [Eubacterium coprostanoligenes]MDY5377147.1 DUF421 domain-containing protein [Eubacterium coprostanoligenes]